MIPAKDFIVVEFDLDARFLKKITLGEFNERRKEEFKNGIYNPNMILLGVFETDTQSDECVWENRNIDELIEAVAKGQIPY